MKSKLEKYIAAIRKVCAQCKLPQTKENQEEEVYKEKLVLTI